MVWFQGTLWTPCKSSFWVFGLQSKFKNLQSNPTGNYVIWENYFHYLSLKENFLKICFKKLIYWKETGKIEAEYTHTEANGEGNEDDYKKLKE